MSVPGQLNFSDLALGFAPPLVLCASLSPLLEQAFGCLSHLEDSHIFNLLQDMQPVPAIGLLAAITVIMYVAGQILLTISDLLRYRSIPVLCSRGRFRGPLGWLFFWLPDLHGPYLKYIESCPGPVLDNFYENLKKINPGLVSEKVKPRTKVWAAAGFLQQHGNFSVAERFNTLAIFMFSIGLWIFLAGVATVLFQVYFRDATHLIAGLALCLLGLPAIYRHSNLYRFFASTVVSGFNSHFSSAANGVRVYPRPRNHTIN